MASVFRKDKYQIKIVTRENYDKWLIENPKYQGVVTFQKFRKYYIALRTAIFQGIIDNPSGVDLDFQLGNLSCKVLDVEFKCSKDFLSTTRNYNGRGAERLQFVTSDMPKKVKITWKKHLLFKSLPSVLAVEAQKTMKQIISKGVAPNLHFYEKAYKYDKAPTKCEEEKPKSLWDLAG